MMVLCVYVLDDIAFCFDDIWRSWAFLFVVNFSLFLCICCYFCCKKRGGLDKQKRSHLCRRQSRRYRPLAVTKWSYLCRRLCRRHRSFTGVPSCLHVAAICRRPAVGTAPSKSPGQCGAHLRCADNLVAVGAVLAVGKGCPDGFCLCRRA